MRMPCLLGSAYIAGILDSEWLPGMGLDECKGLVRKAIRLAMVITLSVKYRLQQEQSNLFIHRMA